MDLFSSGHHITIHGGVGGMGGPGGHVGGAGGNAEGPQFTVSGAENWNVYVAGDLLNYFPSPGNVDPQARWIDSEARNRSSGAVRTLRQIAVPAVAYDASLRPRGVSSNSEEYSTTSFSSTQTPSTQPLKQLTIEQLISPKIQDDVQSLVQSDKLRTLNPQSFDAALRPQCLAGTRQNIITHITEWLTTPSERANILWLHGVAGAGKSTISTTVSEYFRSLRCLGAFLFFDRNNAAGSSPGRVIRNIAYFLAVSNAHIQAAVCDAITVDATLITAPIQTQFRRLLLEPLVAARNQIQGPIIIILDALDECGDPDSREGLVSLIVDEFPKLPAVFRFLIASRPVSDITGRFHGQTHIVPLQLDITTESTRHDIVAYLRQSMQNIRQTKRSLEPDWPGEDVIQTLADYSDGLFIWASTALKFVRSFDPKKRLATLLAAGVANNLDELYTIALRNSADWGDETFAEAAHLVLGAIVLSMEPLTDKTIDKLLGFKNGQAASVLVYLGCVIQWSHGQPARILHASFSDYLTGRPRCGLNFWFVDSKIQSKSLALGCLHVLNLQLHFNICHLEDSQILNADVPALPALVEKHIPAELKYASLFWSLHLRDTDLDEKILVELKGLIYTRFPYWLEVLSLINQVSVAAGSLETARKRVKTDEAFYNLLRDALSFMAGFAPLIAQSAPHIYISALPFTPHQSLIGKQFASSFPCTLRFTGPVGENWSSILKVFPGHTGGVSSVAFSPDGKQIVSGSVDQTVRIWDSETGDIVAGPFEVHTKWGIAVAFSPDGRLIASGDNLRHDDDEESDSGASEDTSRGGLRLWDAKTGTLVTGPIGDDGIESVAFSPDGKLVVSLTDGMMRLWDVKSGALEELFDKHHHWGSSATFSPDGKRIAYVTLEGVNVWDLETDTEVEGSSDEGMSRSTFISFAPDGKWIVSGSDEPTIGLQIWDSETGSVIPAFLEESSFQVTSVTFSPDGKHIIAGGADHRLHVWDSKTGALVGRLRGHTGWVTSVVFSPDGRRIASGSNDGTIRIWDAEVAIGGLANKRFAGHTRGVTCVAFSPDGKQIVSGSADMTVRVWDSKTGALVTTLNAKGNRSVLAISPNRKRIASRSDGLTVCVWNGDTDAVWIFSGYSQCAFSPDGQHIVVGCNRTVKILDSESGAVISGPFNVQTDQINCVAFSPDGHRVGAGFLHEPVRIWDSQTGAVVIGEHTCTWSITFSPDGTKLAAGSGKTVRILDVQTGVLLLAVPSEGYLGTYSSLAFSTDGSRIAVGSADSAVRVLNSETGAVVAGPFEGHTEGVTSVHFSPDGRRVVSGSQDSTIRVWELNNDETLLDSWGNHRWFKDDGWIKDSASAHLLWIPPWLRDGLYSPRNSLVIRSAGTTKLDLTQFVHGRDWHKCIGPK
ncbi:WD40 repeat-like protein [Mycena venus]|uniref:WD40 repeat-like protein n=1 Tax=Mycena venus TaxID=2733690 RepID=A0A8H6YS81_9AGAR|nr:WD40 repeat-like protein [Mycena venus]